MVMQTEAVIEPTTGERTDASSWDILCEAGRAAQQNMDEARWIIGDLALLVKKQYREDRLRDFANEINVEKSRVKEYRTVCRFYEKAARASFLADRPNLTYSHLRDAMRFGSADRAYAFLEEVTTHTWTVDNARIELAKRLGKPVPSLRILDDAACRIVAPQGQRQIIFEFNEDVAKVLRKLFFDKQAGALTMTLSPATA